MAAVLKHLTRYESFVAASDTPFALAAEGRRANLLRFVRGDRPIFDPADPAKAAVLDGLVQHPLTDVRDAVLARKDLRTITDDNMATESRLGWRKRNEAWTWAALLERL